MDDDSKAFASESASQSASKPVSRRKFLVDMAATAGALSLSPLALAQQKPLVPFSNKSLDYYFFATQQEAVKRAVEAKGWTFQAVNANFSTTTQLEQWQSLLLKNPAAIIADPIDSQAIASVIKKYNMKKIPVGIIDTPALAGDVSITVDFDNYAGGVMAAEAIVAALKKKNGSTKGTVLNCYGALQSVAWRLRKEGLEATFKKYPDIKLISRPTEGLLKNMLSVTLATLSEYPDLDAVHAPSDSPARGIVTALQQKGKWKKVGEQGHVIFVNIDGEPAALQWIGDGYMDAVVSQDPIAYAQITVEMLDKYSLKGQPVPLGPYQNSQYFWEKAEITKSVTGPSLVIQPFVVDGNSVKDKRQWGNIAYNEWGLRYS
ncbi:MULTISPECIES: sugar ABC transporter substrate-binding protein [Burkholderiaceae]|uniref:ABC transporter, periplasmic sugar-binding protein n=1 Tax=Caballeronia sordidicola TaxID=196367 RepID=A0A242N2K1_CABSO|nr:MULTISPECIES: sugar ABC transporter substrate-binding protein [Burkholderiaceae]OTP77901.1 ABC transporter, periplasmic sugar-binding protein precursor [Caballeronia sordidicola]